MSNLPSGTTSSFWADQAKSYWQAQRDAYLEKIKPYEGTEFYQQLLDNPYYQYQEFSPTFWQQLWSGMTSDYSPMHTFYNDRATSGDEYLSQVLDTMRQQNYNDPANQLLRRERAGLNDALSGGSQIGAGDPAGVVPDETPPVQQPPTNEIATVMTVGFDLFKNILSFGHTIQSMVGTSIDNAAKDIQLTDSGYDSILKMLAGSSSLPATREEYDALTEDQKKSMDDELFDSLEAAIKTGQLGDVYSTRKAKRLVKLMRGQIMYDKDGNPTLAYQRYRSKLLAERYEDHEKAAKSMGNVAFDEDLAQFASSIADKFGSVDLAIRKAQQKIAESEASYSEQYYNTQGVGPDGEPITVGQADALSDISGDVADIESAARRKVQAQLDKELDEIFASLLNECKGSDKWYHVIARFLIPIARASIYRTLDSSFTTTTKKKGVSTKLTF